MSFFVACGLAGLVVAFHLLTLQSEFLAWRNARRGLYDLDSLQTSTGIMRRPELEDLIGPPGEDSLYRVDPGTWSRLPRLHPLARLALGPTDGIAALALGCAALSVTLVGGEPAWGWVGAALGAFLFEVLVATIYVLRWRPDEEVDEPELPSDEALEGMAAIPSARALGEVLDLELRRVEQSLERTRRHGGLTWWERKFDTCVDLWSRRGVRRERLRAAKLLESSEALAEQIREQREALRTLIRASDDLDEAVELCEHELHVERVLTALEGEAAAR